MAFTLQDINDAAEAKYGSTDFELESGTLHLQNPLRLSDADRKELGRVQEFMDDEDADQKAIMSDAIRLVSKEKKRAEELLESLGDDLGKIASVFEMYSKGTQVGEASASES